MYLQFYKAFFTFNDSELKIIFQKINLQLNYKYLFIFAKNYKQVKQISKMKNKALHAFFLSNQNSQIGKKNISISTNQESSDKQNSQSLINKSGISQDCDKSEQGNQSIFSLNNSDKNKYSTQNANSKILSSRMKYFNQLRSRFKSTFRILQYNSVAKSSLLQSGTSHCSSLDQTNSLKEFQNKYYKKVQCSKINENSNENDSSKESSDATFIQHHQQQSSKDNASQILAGTQNILQDISIDQEDQELFQDFQKSTTKNSVQFAIKFCEFKFGQKVQQQISQIKFSENSTKQLDSIISLFQTILQCTYPKQYSYLKQIFKNKDPEQIFERFTEINKSVSKFWKCKYNVLLCQQKFMLGHQLVPVNMTRFLQCGSWANLQYASFVMCKIDNKSWKLFAQKHQSFTCLKILNLMGNQIQTVLIQQILNFKNLQHISYVGNPLTQTSLQNLQNLKKTSEFNDIGLKYVVF